MPIVRQLSVFMENKPHALSLVTKVLATGKINLVAFAVPDARGEGILRLVPSDPNRAKSLFKAKGVPFNETKVLALLLPDRPGAVYDVTHRLAKASIEISYAYGSTSPHEGSTTIIFNVSDPMRAEKLLEVENPIPHGENGRDRSEEKPDHVAPPVVKMNKR